MKLEDMTNEQLEDELKHLDEVRIEAKEKGAKIQSILAQRRAEEQADAWGLTPEEYDEVKTGDYTNLVAALNEARRKKGAAAKAGQSTRVKPAPVGTKAKGV